MVFGENKIHHTTMGTKKISVSDIAKAKKVPIPLYFDRVILTQSVMYNYYYNNKVDFNHRQTCRCPLHDEKTPSMRYYEETNSFYCFGCGRGGSVINLHLYFMRDILGIQTTFEDAVIYLKSLISDKNLDSVEDYTEGKKFKKEEGRLIKLKALMDANSISAKLEEGCTETQILFKMDIIRNLYRLGKIDEVSLFEALTDIYKV